MEDTIAAISTSSGAGAISIIRISGPESINIINKNNQKVRFGAADAVPKRTFYFMFIPYDRRGTSRTDPLDIWKDSQEYRACLQLPEGRCGLFRRVLPPGVWTVRLHSRRGRSCLR